MRILSFGLDNSVLDKNSRLAKRVIEYGQLVDSYGVLVPSENKIKIQLSDNTWAIGSGGFNKFFQLFKIYRIGKKILKQKNFDIISVQDQYFLALAAYCLAKKFKKGLEIQVHGFEKYKGVRKIIFNFVIKKVGAIRVVSERLKNKLIKEFGIKEDKITVAPIFVEYKIKGRKDKKQNNKFVFLTVSRLVKVKNIDLQIEAIRNIVDNFSNVELWIVGDGPERENLKSKVKKYNLEDHIKFFGWQEDLERFYSEADCFVLTSDSEGWGLAILEAASYGLPIIMTDVGLSGEIIRNKESGLIVPLGDFKILEESMIQIIKDENLREKLSQGAQEAIRNLFSQEEIFNLYKKSWSKALK